MCHTWQEIPSGLFNINYLHNEDQVGPLAFTLSEKPLTARKEQVTSGSPAKPREDKTFISLEAEGDEFWSHAGDNL